MNLFFIKKKRKKEVVGWEIFNNQLSGKKLGCIASTRYTRASDDVRALNTEVGRETHNGSNSHFPGAQESRCGLLVFISRNL
jgi:hypothetical protein